MSTRRGKSSAGPPSPNPLFLTLNTNPDVPVYEIVQKTLKNGKIVPGRACEICGQVIAIGSKGSLHAFDTHKSACQLKNSRSTASRPAGLGDRARSLSAAPSTRSLSPLVIPSPSLSPSLPGTPASSPHSPILGSTQPPSNTTFDSGDHGSLTDLRVPLIAVNPPSDDVVSWPISLSASPSLQVIQTACIGMVVRWRPGTIWETYPFPSHSFVRHPWHILEVCPPEHLRLRSVDCTSTVSPGGFESTCHNCLRIPQSEAFQTVQKRAGGALPHTPHGLLSFRQLSTIPKKMKKLLDQARIKVLELSTKQVP